MDTMLDIANERDVLPAIHAQVLAEARDFALAQGNVEAALVYSEREVAIYQQTGDVSGSALNAMAALAWQKGNTVAAVKYFKDYLHLLEAEEQTGSCAHILNTLGRIHLNGGEYDNALVCFEQAATLGRQVHQNAGIASNLCYIAQVYFEQDRYSEALATVQESLNLYQSLNHVPGTAKALNLSGRVYTSLAQWRAAQECLQEALALFRQLGNTHLIKAVEQHLEELKTAQQLAARAGRGD